jgi:D-glycero-alpha-D-manno-heptose-7-phosphate kinase
MIITKSPYRISFFGGGTDYHTWYQEHGGAFLSTSIDKYVYITLRKMKPFFNHKYHVVWRQIEQTLTIDEIQHPVVREAFRLYNTQNERLSLHYEGDLPGQSGIGSSSAFTCAIIQAMHALFNKHVTKFDIAKQAIHLERDILKEAVGVQDQIATAVGGFNHVTIDTNGNFAIHPLVLTQDVIDTLTSHMLLFFTGLQRNASEIASEQISSSPITKKNELHTMAEMVGEGVKILLGEKVDYQSFGKLLHESWLLKRGLTSKITNNIIDDIYSKALNNGAIGGKLLGAGGGGFMLIFAEPHTHKAILNALSELLYIPFQFEDEGTTILHNKERLSIFFDCWPSFTSAVRVGPMKTSHTLIQLRQHRSLCLVSARLPG